MLTPFICNTTGEEHAISRAVDREGHGEHTGWSCAATGDIVCACGEVLFRYEAVVSR